MSFELTVGELLRFWKSERPSREEFVARHAAFLILEGEVFSRSGFTPNKAKSPPADGGDPFRQDIHGPIVKEVKASLSQPELDDVFNRSLQGEIVAMVINLHKGAKPSGFVVQRGTDGELTVEDLSRKKAERERILATRVREVTKKAGANADPDIVVGRSLESDIDLASPKVSRRHARFRRQGADYQLLDEGSSNGTYVNGKRLDPGAAYPLYPGDKVWFQPVIAVFADAGTLFDYLEFLGRTG